MYDFAKQTLAYADVLIGLRKTFACKECVEFSDGRRRDLASRQSATLDSF